MYFTTVSLFFFNLFLFRTNGMNIRIIYVFIYYKVRYATVAYGNALKEATAYGKERCFTKERELLLQADHVLKNITVSYLQD